MTNMLAENSTASGSMVNNTDSHYDPQKDACIYLARLIINTVIAGGLCLFGLAGNAISFVVLRRDKQTPVASFLLQTLALMDSLFIGLWTIHFSLIDLFEYARQDPYSYKYLMYIRLYSYPFLYIAQTATIWCTVLIALTRFIAVCIPYRATQLCNLQLVKKSVLVLCVFSVLYNVPRFCDTVIMHVPKNGTIKYHFALAPLGGSAVYRLVYLDIAYYLFSFVLPLLILAVLNTKLTVAYRRVQQKRRHLRGRTENETGASSRSSHHSDPNITLVMIIVVLVFMLCNLPARVVQIVWEYRDQECLSAAFFIKEISNVLEVFNSSTNFIIYCVFRKQFRDILWKLLHCQSDKPSTSEATTNTQLNGYTMVSKDVQDKAKDGVTNGDRKHSQV